MPEDAILRDVGHCCMGQIFDVIPVKTGIQKNTFKSS